MHTEVVQRLLDLNSQFYQVHASGFAETRTRLQPGVRTILDDLDPAAAVLDVGCGHGIVARELVAQDHIGPYTGIDTSPNLIGMAAQAVQTSGCTFLLADITQPEWAARLPQAYDVILAFAVLHHIPGSALRAIVAKQLAARVRKGGCLEVSVWNFLASARLRERILPWDHLGLSADDVDPGDHLLDWRHGGSGLRYVHAFTPASLAALASQAGLAVTSTRYSDGEAGLLGLYQRWEKER
jgi:tRNA (uracil-5-)-methyltransferase TRM9